MNVVAIVGRPNVGKSTIFNRLIGERMSIIEDTPGVTRDRIYGRCSWNGKNFVLIDTGGFIPGAEDKIERAIREQAMVAIEEADSVIFVVDGRDGVTKFDEEIAEILRKTDKPVTIIVNKCDNYEQDAYAYEFYSLGLGDPFPISAVSGRSTGDFLDKVVEPLDPGDLDEEDERLKIAFVGRPNVGKSSLTNAVLGEERTIVTDIPGTTRDAIDTVLKYYSEEIVLIDTAGLRKRTHVHENVEQWSVIRTARAIDRCDVGVVIVDATRGLEDQEKKILNQLEEARKGMIIAINKWDLVEKDHKTADNMTKEIYEGLRTLDYVPIVYISAKERQRIFKVIDMAKEIKEKRNSRVPTHQLNETILPELDRTPPPSVRGFDLRINYITQVGMNPPVFAFFSNQPKLIPDSYKRYMERAVRKHFDFEGTPISFVFRRKNTPWEERDER